MGWLDMLIAIATILVGITLMVVVMMQESKSSSSAVTGGSNTFYGANKSKTLDGTLSKFTVVLALVFIALCVMTTIAIMH